MADDASSGSASGEAPSATNATTGQGGSTESGHVLRWGNNAAEPPPTDWSEAAYDSFAGAPAPLWGDAATEAGLRFRRFPSFKNAYSEKMLAAIEAHGHGAGEWIATEKIHGSNFSFVTDGTSVAVAKRTGLLQPVDKFFNWPYIYGKVYDAVVRTHALVAEKHAADDAAAEAEGEGGANHAAAETGSFLTRTHNEADDEGVDPISGRDDRLIVWIFGELFGGYYPHKDVVEPPADEPGAIMIQKQVYYSSHTEFYAFDIHAGRGFMDYYPAMEILSEAGFMCSFPPMHSGTLQEMIDLDPLFDTEIPAALGLPAFPSNVSEGYVLKPARNLYFGNGSRCMLKHKNAVFGEKCGIVNAGQKKVKPAKPQEDWPEEAARLREVLLSMLVPARLDSVISKEGEVSESDGSRLMGLFCSDALTDFMDEEEEAFAGLPKKWKKKVKASMAPVAKRILTDFFQDRA